MLDCHRNSLGLHPEFQLPEREKFWLNVRASEILQQKSGHWEETSYIDQTNKWSPGKELCFSGLKIVQALL